MGKQEGEMGLLENGSRGSVKDGLEMQQEAQVPTEKFLGSFIQSHCIYSQIQDLFLSREMFIFKNFKVLLLSLKLPGENPLFLTPNNNKTAHNSEIFIFGFLVDAGLSATKFMQKTRKANLGWK